VNSSTKWRKAARATQEKGAQREQSSTLELCGFGITKRQSQNWQTLAALEGQRRLARLAADAQPSLPTITSFESQVRLSSKISGKNNRFLMATPAGLEPATCRLEVPCPAFVFNAHSDKNAFFDPLNHNGFLTLSEWTRRQGMAPPEARDV
jgi:hypothetical protein